MLHSLTINTQNTHMENTQRNIPWKISFGKITDRENKVICTLPNNRVQADANLLATAPELLAVIKKVATLIYNTEGDQWQEAYEAIEAAIAKAEGKTQ